MRVRVAYSRCQNLLSKGLFVDFLEKLKVKEELVCWPIWRKILAEQSFIILEIKKWHKQASISIFILKNFIESTSRRAD